MCIISNPIPQMGMAQKTEITCPNQNGKNSSIQLGMGGGQTLVIIQDQLHILHKVLGSYSYLMFHFSLWRLV